MKLLTLKIKNFKGIRDFTIDPQGNDLSIYAENGTGKTTVADAYYWLLFGKDSLGRKDYEIKTIGEDGEPIHFLDHSVEGIFETENGDKLTLARTYKEKWVKQRGSATDSFTGHETEFTINGVPQSAGEYQDYIASICDEGQFRQLTDASAFSSLEWKDRRYLLFDMCGLVSRDVDDRMKMEAMVIASDPQLAELPLLLGKYSVDDLRKMTEAQRTKVNDERKTVPARIDEADRALPAPDKTDWNKLLTGYASDLQEVQDERSKLQAGGKAAELRSTIIEIDSKRRAIESDLRNKPNPEREEATKAKRQVQIEIESVQSSISSIDRDIRNLTRDLTSSDELLASKRRLAIAERERVYSGNSECPSCKRALPEDQIESAIAEFNTAKATRLEKMVAEGKSLAADHDKTQAELDAKRNDLATSQANLLTLQTEYDAIVIPAETPSDPAKNPEYVKLAAERERMQKQLDKLNEDSAEALQDVNTRIIAAQEKVTEAQQGIARTKQRTDGLGRLEELKAREKELGALYESLERSLFLCEQFVRAKVRLLTEQINSRFKLTTFRLFKEQINGGLQECCDVLWRENGAQPSNGQAVQIGLDIISTLSEHLNFAPTIFVDNSESITHFPKTQGQQIRLIVNALDEKMRIVQHEPTESNDELFARVGTVISDKDLALF
jgi:hypothetical protein